MSVQPGPRVAVKMEVAPFYSEDGLELLPDFVQLPPGFNGEAAAAEEEESGAQQQQQQKLLLVASKKVLPRTATQPDLGGGASSSEAAGRFPVLPGPEGSLLKLPGAAPDLEQLLLPGLSSPASPGLLFRPPPTSAPPPPPPPPSAVTQEQEGFADGFVKALADLHKQNQLLGVSPAPLSPSLCPPPPPRQEAVYTTLGGFDPGSPPPPPSGTTTTASSAFFSRRALEEPQTVPEASPGVPPPPPLPLSSGDSPPPPPSSLSPLDAESQERLKAERKRLRNRIAASKCRRRKLERIARLEEKVKALKGQNAELAATASLLRAQVAQLQGRVRSHLSSGCPINANAAAPEARPEAEAC
nr:transcription factor Jun-like [Anolis sagrei ordinatus]